MCLAEYAQRSLFDGSKIAQYLRKQVTPPLDQNQVALEALTGPERSGLRTPITGTISLVLRYKGYEGVVSSLDEVGDELDILQLQGAKSRKSLRLASGVNWHYLFADQTLAIAQAGRYRRIAMPELWDIAGLSDAASFERASQGYLAAAARLGLRPSAEERKFVRDLV